MYFSTYEEFFFVNGEVKKVISNMRFEIDKNFLIQEIT